MNALQVWHEYLPARVNDNAKIYRNFDMAGIVNLMMLDTRIIGRDKPLNYNLYLTQNGIDRTAFLSDWQNPARSILGAEQRAWLMSQISTSQAKWQVLGSQVLMGKIFIPAELLIPTAQIASGNPSPELLARYNALLTQLVTIKSRLLQGDPTLSAGDRARVETVLPYNLDAWDGYPVERETIFAAAAGKELISLAEDSHNAWHSNLSDASGNKAGTEFATASVSAPGIEVLFGNNPGELAGVEQAFTVLINDLKFLNASQRGYLMVTFSNSNSKADWRFVRTLETKDSTATSRYTASEA